jgi:hypothetical protein
MKNYYFIIAYLVLQLSNVNNTFGQTRSDVATPKNSAVEAYITPEDNASTRAYYDAAYTTASRTLIKYFNDGYSASGRFNCHGYAWHMVEGGAPRWIGYYVTTNEDIYMTDGSYIQVCNETYPGKVSWGAGGDHSAITTTTPGRWTSKWNRYPLMTHGKDDTPFGSTYNYYVSTKISGSTAALCSGTRVFSVQNVSGATYSWTYSSGLLAVSATNQASFTVQRNGTGSGTQWVEVSITTPCSGTSVTSRLEFNVVSQLTGTYSTSTATKPLNTVNFVKAGNIFAQYQWPGVTNLSAVLAPGSPSGTGFYSTSSTFSFNLAVNQNISVYILGTGPCGDQLQATRTFVYSSSPFRLVASPNPAKENISLEISALPGTLETPTAEPSKNLSGNSTGITKVFLYDLYTNLLVRQWTYREAKSGNYNLNIAGMKSGVYMLKVERDNKQSTTKVIVQ